MTLKDELPRWVGAHYTTVERGEIIPERMKRENRVKVKIMPSCGSDW